MIVSIIGYLRKHGYGYDPFLQQPKTSVIHWYQNMTVLNAAQR